MDYFLPKFENSTLHPKIVDKSERAGKNIENIYLDGQILIGQNKQNICGLYVFKLFKSETIYLSYMEGTRRLMVVY